MSTPVHLLVLFDFKQIDKNPGGDDDAQKRAKFMITTTRDPIICNGSVEHSRWVANLFKATQFCFPLWCVVNMHTRALASVTIRNDQFWDGTLSVCRFLCLFRLFRWNKLNRNESLGGNNEKTRARKWQVRWLLAFIY